MNNTSVTSTPFWNNILQWANLGGNNQVSQQSNLHNSSTSLESRELMIRRLYRTILGRDPDPNGLNYFLNNNLTEYEIAKEMYESTEHVDILNKAKDVRNLIIKYKEATEKIQELENKLNATENLLKKYKELLSQNEIQTKTYNKNNQANNTEQEPNLNQMQTNEQLDAIILEDPFKDNTQRKNKFLSFIKDWFSFD